MVKTEKCEDVNCPIHGSLKTHGRTFKGYIVSNKAQKSAIVEWSRLRKVLKYERYEKRKTRVQVHRPLCMNIKEGDYVEIKECRPLSKTKKFVIMGLVQKTKDSKTITKKEKTITKK